jgi:hypothetical protein
MGERAKRRLKPRRPPLRESEGRGGRVRERRMNGKVGEEALEAPPSSPARDARVHVFTRWLQTYSHRGDRNVYRYISISISIYLSSYLSSYLSIYLSSYIYIYLYIYIYIMYRDAKHEGCAMGAPWAQRTDARQMQRWIHEKKRIDT